MENIFIAKVGKVRYRAYIINTIIIGVLRGDEEDDQVVGIFNIIQKNPNTVVHLKVDEAMEGCAGM